MEYIEFGRTGLQVSRLCVGTGTHGWGHHSEQTALGVEGLAGLLRLAYDNGVTFWDAADQYGSHAHIARALRDVPRDAVVIATKTNSRRGTSVARDVERFLRELETDVLDVVLLHYMTRGDWPRRYAEAMEALSRAKEQGKVRAVGVSCHGTGALRAAAETEWTDVVLARINYAGVNMDGAPDEVVPLLARLHAADKAVYGMKVLGCGRLAHDARRAIAYVLGLGTVHAITIGMSRPEHVRQNCALVSEITQRQSASGEPCRAGL